MSYLYETHLHTIQASACALSAGREYIKRYKDLGYAGIMVTDHFYHGNSPISRHLPWNQWVDYFCRGYEDARNEGARQGLDVFFGWEETFDGDDYLVYGLDKQWLLEHPEAARWTRLEQYRAVERHGGCVVQAHPFRQHYYIKKIHLSTGCVHGVEAGNAANMYRSYDALALRYAQKLEVSITAGSDIHYIGDADGAYGVYLDRKMTDIQDYVRAIRGRTLSLETARIPAGRWDWTGEEKVTLPVVFRDQHDRPTGQTLRDFLSRQTQQTH